MTLTRWLAVILLVSASATVATVADAAPRAHAAVHADSPKKGAPKKKAKGSKKPGHAAPKKSAKAGKKKGSAKKPKHKSETESTPAK